LPENLGLGKRVDEISSPGAMALDRLRPENSLGPGFVDPRLQVATQFPEPGQVLAHRHPLARLHPQVCAHAGRTKKAPAHHKRKP